ncbi:MAG: tetratricopeptide repeat protein [Gammaproteobacteria bacterium]
MTADSKKASSVDGDQLIAAQVQLIRQRFARLIAETPIAITETALAIAQEERPELELAGCREDLQQLVDSYQQIRRQVGPVTVRDEARLLCRFIAEEQGFQGNNDDYYDPDNSYLDQLLERRMGIPISLALLYLHVGRGQGLQVEGIGFPGHFLVAVVVGEERALIDPFVGCLLSDTRLRHLLEQQQGPGAELQERFLRPVSARELILRLLGNLRSIYHQQGDYPRLLACCDRMLLIDPDNLELLLDRVGAYQRLHQPAMALAELARLRTLAPTDDYRRQLERLMLEIDGASARPH